jgi:hypothetical protein
MATGTIVHAAPTNALSRFSYVESWPANVACRAARATDSSLFTLYFLTDDCPIAGARFWHARQDDFSLKYHVAMAHRLSAG